VVVPTIGRPAHLKKTFQALQSQQHLPREVVVGIDGPSAEVEQVCQQAALPFPIRYTALPQQQGLSAARNAAAGLAGGELLLFLDDDTPPAPDCLLAHVHTHAQPGPEKLVVFGPIVEHYDRAPLSHLEAFFREQRKQDLSTLASAAERGDNRHGVYFGVNCSIRRELFLATGGYDSALEFVDEEFELGTRMLLSGFQFRFLPEAVIYHDNSKDLREYFKQIAYWSARRDLRRVRMLGQRNTRTARLSRIRGSLRQRAGMRVAWSAPELVAALEPPLRVLADRVPSRLLARTWASVAAGRYWKSLKDAGENIQELAALVPTPTAALMFHSLVVPKHNQHSDYLLDPEQFRRLLRFLKLAGISSIHAEQWINGSGTRRGCQVMLTVDDGYEDFYQNGLPALLETGMKATVFVVVDRIGACSDWDAYGPLRGLMTLPQLREVARHGIRIGSHTLTHRRLTQLPASEVRQELRDAKRKLEDLLGMPITELAYPFGDVNLRVRAEAEAAGYETGFTTNSGLNRWEDRLLLKRVNVSGRESVLEHILKIWLGYDLRDALHEAVRR
jgi:peptidoglycan/xylan/chitin deacetylase (PgdA/CDA1 family)/GT2 family glycosyltransferase